MCATVLLATSNWHVGNLDHSRAASTPGQSAEKHVKDSSHVGRSHHCDAMDFSEYIGCLSLLSDERFVAFSAALLAHGKQVFCRTMCRRTTAADRGARASTGQYNTIPYISIACKIVSCRDQ